MEALGDIWDTPVGNGKVQDFVLSRTQGLDSCISCDLGGTQGVRIEAFTPEALKEVG